MDDLWAPFPTNPFPIGFEMAAAHSLLSFIGRTWEKGNKASWVIGKSHLGHGRPTLQKTLIFSPHIGRGRRKEPEKLILSSCSCKCSLSSSSARSEIVSSAPLWLKPRRIFLFLLFLERKMRKALGKQTREAESY